MYVMLSCVFVSFPYGVLGQVCYLIVAIPVFAFFVTLLTLKEYSIGFVQNIEQEFS